MSDFIDCNSNSIPDSVFLKSLVSKRTSDNTYFFRIVSSQATTVTSVLECLDRNEFIFNLRRATVIASDGKPAVHVFRTEFNDGVGLEDVPECGQARSIEQLFSMCFGVTNLDEFVLLVADIT